ncbi:Hypothetical protein GbCGDNIH3_1955 [Granulibacter bethesdensis]|uniref:Secreted protein n=2 Tax=Granulibacter bethesdensis TaxID=364410 RepID=A0AAN0RF61_9PROT|nr:Hypothetical protein GbCGDNIH3_1955 [Granulibacter bethesdensis]
MRSGNWQARKGMIMAHDIMPRHRMRAQRLSALALLAGVPFSSHPAFADQPAHLVPQKDVSVVYTLTGAKAGETGRPRQGRLFYSSKVGEARIEADRQPGFLLLDPRQDRATLVLNQINIYVTSAISSTPVSALVLSPTENFTRTGTSRIAGIACTLWHVTSRQGQGTICLSDDGILLSGEGTDTEGRTGSLHATSVKYAPQPQTLFRIPDGYQKMDLPPGMVQGLLSGNGQGALQMGGAMKTMRNLIGR